MRVSIVRFGLVVTLLTVMGGTGFALSGSVRVRGELWLPERLIDGLRTSFAESSPDLRLDWQTAGAGSAFIGLFDGSADIGMSGRSATVRERALARRLGVDLREFVITLDAIAVIVHPSNPITSLSMGQLQTLYSGKIVRWMGVGGGDDAVRLLAPPRASGVTGAFAQIVLPDGDMAANIEHLESSEQVVAAVAADARAVGIVSITLVDDGARVVPLLLDGGTEGAAVAPTPETVREATYPLAYGLRAYTLGDPSIDLHRVLSFLMWRDGRVQLERAGFTPLLGLGAVKRETGTEVSGPSAQFARIGFGFRGARLDNQARGQLTALAELASESDRDLWIVGHQEPEEAQPARDLALERARSVADFLAQQGFSETKMTAESAGWDEPIASNDTLDGRRLNRRVDVWVLNCP